MILGYFENDVTTLLSSVVSSLMKYILQYLGLDTKRRCATDRHGWKRIKDEGKPVATMMLRLKMM